jgi:hypothetical protein
VNPDSDSGSESRRVKIVPKKEKKRRSLRFSKALWWAGGFSLSIKNFSWSLNVIFNYLRINIGTQ